MTDIDYPQTFFFIVKTNRLRTEPLVGSADIQSLADMGNSYDIVQTMRTAPITKDTVFRLTVATLVPIVAL